MMPTVEFMVALNKIDRSELTPRHVVILFAIKAKPGMNGVELYKKLNYPTRTYIQNQIAFLIEKGWAEDRRIKEHDLTPSVFHITPAGAALLADIMGHGQPA